MLTGLGGVNMVILLFEKLTKCATFIREISCQKKGLELKKPKLLISLHLNSMSWNYNLSIQTHMSSTDR